MSKQLGQFLQEQQEPFTLELYLLERGQFRSKHLISDDDFRCCSRNFSSTNFLKRSARCGAKKRRKVLIPSCSKIVKSVFNKFVTISHNQKYKNLANDQEHNNNSTSKNTNIIAYDDHKFSSASSPTVFHSCSDSSDAEEAENLSSPQAADDNFLHEKQVFEDRRRLRLDFLEESKQLSPVSVLEETESSDDDDDSPDVKKEECVKAKKQEEFSTPSSPESQYIKNKKAIQQSRQLLFDCVKEVVDNHKSKDPQKEEFQRILGAEQLWELVLQNICLWSQDSINETNVNHLMHFDLLNSFEQLCDVEEKREIGKVVGDLIFVDISNEIVLDMLNYYYSR